MCVTIYVTIYVQVLCQDCHEVSNVCKHCNTFTNGLICVYATELVGNILYVCFTCLFMWPKLTEVYSITFLYRFYTDD